jgi:hypothetical protein
MAYTPNKNREVKNGKAMVSAAELADFRKEYGEKSTLRDLLNADKGLTRRGEKTVYPQVEPKVKNQVTPDQVGRVARAVGVMEPSNASTADMPRVNQENMDVSDMSYNKKGGAIKMAKGGMTASSRADGIATKGKTRGKMC